MMSANSTRTTGQWKKMQIIMLRLQTIILFIIVIEILGDLSHLGNTLPLLRPLGMQALYFLWSKITIRPLEYSLC